MSDRRPSPPRRTDPPWRWSPAAGAGCFALAFAGSYPGRLNVDTLSSLLNAAGPAGPNNWHSPTLLWLWELPAGWLVQPTAALLVQAALFGWFGGFLPRLPATPRGYATLAGEALLRAALAGAAGYAGKDAVMLLALLVAVQLIRGGADARPRSATGAATGAALVAVGLLFVLAKAPNFLTVVVALALVLPFRAPTPARYAAVMAAALTVGGLAVPLNRGVDRFVFGARDLHPDKQLVLFDLAGISVHTGRDAFADVPGWPAGLPAVRGCYLPYMWDGFAPWAPCGGYARAYDTRDGALTRHWLASIARHPLAYAAHRLDYAGALMVSRDHDTWGIGGRSSNDAGDAAALAELRQGMADTGSDRAIALWRPNALTAPLRALEAALFRFPKVQWAGLIACLTVLLLSWLRRAEGWSRGAVVAAALGVGNAAMLLVFGVADPARYLLPTVALGYVALLALAAPRAGRDAT